MTTLLEKLDIRRIRNHYAAFTADNVKITSIKWDDQLRQWFLIPEEECIFLQQDLNQLVDFINALPVPE